jgi:hypothetical protein
MQVALFTVRNLKTVSGLAFCLAMLPAMSHAFTQDGLSEGCRSVFGKPGEQSASAK